MFNKKELGDLQEQTTAIQTKMEEFDTWTKMQDQKMKEFAQEVVGNQIMLKEEISELKSAQNSALQEFTQHIEDIGRTKDKFEKSISTFSLLQQKLEETLYTKLNKAMSEEMRKLYTQTKSYAEIKKDVERAIITMSKINNSVLELDEISKSIGQADVNISKFMDKVNYEDKHKLGLMKENETLKKLVSSIRRQG